MDKDSFFEMVISSVCFLFMVVFAIEPAAGLDDCPESRCGDYGSVIRFPFRIKGIHPEHCGYPGFELSCTQMNDTLLELPLSVNLLVKNIDYKLQLIQAYDQHNCLWRQIHSLSLSASPFYFQGQGVIPHGYTLFNCSPAERDSLYEYDLISCLSSPAYKVYAVTPYTKIREWPLSFCSKIYNTQEVPLYRLEDNISLVWSKPLCQHCEAKGRKCRLKNNSTNYETECIGNQKGIILGSFLIVLVVIGVLYRVYVSYQLREENQERIEKFLEDYKALKPTRYSYADIKKITNRFNEKLGEGAYGTVFKGWISKEILVAVKILNTSKGNGEEFINEVGAMGRIHHVNVVRFVGFCADGFRRALVYEFLPNGSVQNFICSPDNNKDFLGWEKLQEIALGIAKGIEYLHHGCDQRILHFDIKPHNVLLDYNLTPKICDFGLAKLCSKDLSVVSMTAARGTIGYIAPEVFSRNFGQVSYKADVYSFGMLLLEMIGGRKNIDVTVENVNHVYYPEWIYNLLEEREDLRIQTEDEGDPQIATKLAIVGLWCIQWHPVDRPSMKIVVQMLEGEQDKLTIPPNPFSPTSPTQKNACLPARHTIQDLEVIHE
ncbi:Receptor-like kinase [Quillaja saponaria]|uniref:non-specific serine/threonine protein kinase n=1 Tax=Quillaja saponaria TaxID=32244 RepID=A0AAD7LJM5_QUISA|nr:Receptor-like kinase [Quillaja saponaria]